LRENGFCSMEQGWNKGNKKGLTLNRVNPWYLLVGDRGIEPLASSVSRISYIESYSFLLVLIIT
jgi:hypothetical protein